MRVLEVLASSPWRVKLLVSLDLLSCQYPHHHGFHHFLFVFATSLVIKSVVLERWPTFGMATTETQNKTKRTRTQLSHGPAYALLCSGDFHEHFSCCPIIYPWLSRHASRTHWVLVLGVSVHEKGGLMSMFQLKLAATQTRGLIRGAKVVGSWPSRERKLSMFTFPPLWNRIIVELMISWGWMRINKRCMRWLSRSVI